MQIPTNEDECFGFRQFFWQIRYQTKHRTMLIDLSFWRICSCHSMVVKSNEKNSIVEKRVFRFFLHESVISPCTKLRLTTETFFSKFLQRWAQSFGATRIATASSGSYPQGLWQNCFGYVFQSLAIRWILLSVCWVQHCLHLQFGKKNLKVCLS